ncbi:rhodanese-like domain-containing protein [Roseibium sp.]|uniref:rhodanese-like domain-containing protein n=1 Tax=Roseibium sp. TaxID=1936156 RepID=UPI003D0C3DEA
MPKNLKISSAELVTQARAQIEEIDAKEAIALVEDPRVQFVDLRDIRERKHSGYIPGSFHCPRGMTEFWVDPESPYFKEIFGEDKKFVFHCAAGWRSALTVATLKSMGFEAAHITDGFADWVKQGGPVEKDD